MQQGRGIARLLWRAVAALERMASAQEELNTLAKDEREVGEQIENQPGPPFCPHCNRIDPIVRTQAEGTGLLSNFVLVMQCSHCSNTFYGLAEGWMIAPDIDAAKELRDAKKGGD
jgi:hypothetical protein